MRQSPDRPEPQSIMTKYEYKITKHTTESFSQMAYFCSDKGDCAVEEVPSDQEKRLSDMLNERGEQGWELIQLFFGKNGLVAFWKRLV